MHWISNVVSVPRWEVVGLKPGQSWTLLGSDIVNGRIRRRWLIYSQRMRERLFRLTIPFLDYNRDINNLHFLLLVILCTYVLQVWRGWCWRLCWLPWWVPWRLNTTARAPSSPLTSGPTSARSHRSSRSFWSVACGVCWWSVLVSPGSPSYRRSREATSGTTFSPFRPTSRRPGSSHSASECSGPERRNS